MGRREGFPLPGEDEPLHAYITATNLVRFLMRHFEMTVSLVSRIKKCRAKTEFNEKNETI